MHLVVFLALVMGRVPVWMKWRKSYCQHCISNFPSLLVWTNIYQNNKPPILHIKATFDDNCWRQNIKQGEGDHSWGNCPPHCLTTLHCWWCTWLFPQHICCTEQYPWHRRWGCFPSSKNQLIILSILPFQFASALGLTKTISTSEITYSPH